MLVGFVLAGRHWAVGADPHRLAGFGGVAGIFALLCVMFAGPLQASTLLGIGATFIGVGAGLFAVGTLTAAMTIADPDVGGHNGLALGAWGAVQATAAGLAIVIGALTRDAVSAAAIDHQLGSTLAGPTTGYAVVYGIEIVLLLGTLVALGPLVRGNAAPPKPSARLGLSEFPI
jgi:BCD family chlorophyll transporter-like MFS transporter